MKTILRKEIPKETRAVVYLCDYSYNPVSIKVEVELFFTTIFDGLNAYVNIPNPESQLAKGKTYKELIEDLKLLHNRMRDERWLKQLGDAL